MADPLLDAILDSWDRNNTILINLFRLVPAELMDLRGTATSHSLGELFTHMHYCRLVFVFEDAPEIVPVEPKGEYAIERDRDRMVQKLNDSAAAVREAVRTRIASGRPMDRHYDHPILMLQHFIWHEGYHQGQIKLVLKQNGRAIDDEEAGDVTWDVWMDKAADRQRLSDARRLSTRQPTSHERQSGRPWDASYQDGPAPWEIGGPQPAIARLAAERALVGPVLDSGCGSGANALHLATRGLAVVGVDVAETALARARQEGAERGLNIEFVAADAFNLNRLGRTFPTVIDSGMFHTCDAEEQMRYAASLASVTEPNGTLYVLCFSDAGPDTGPHPVSENDLRTAFNPGTGWTIVSLEADRIGTRYHEHGAPAWLATIRRR